MSMLGAQRRCALNLSITGPGPVDQGAKWNAGKSGSRVELPTAFSGNRFDNTNTPGRAIVSGANRIEWLD